jgi:hypothetical protein
VHSTTLPVDARAALLYLQVSEQEPAAPLPSDAIVMVQVDPTAAPGGPEQIAMQLRALAATLKAAAAEKGLPLTALLVQYHSGVANAAPQGTPLTYFPGEEQQQQQGGGAGQIGVFSDVLCEVKFRVSPNAFFQVRSSHWEGNFTLGREQHSSQALPCMQQRCQTPACISVKGYTRIFVSSMQPAQTCDACSLHCTLVMLPHQCLAWKLSTSDELQNKQCCCTMTNVLCRLHALRVDGNRQKTVPGILSAYLCYTCLPACLSSSSTLRSAMTALLTVQASFPSAYLYQHMSACLPAYLPASPPLPKINNGATCLLYNTVGRMAGVGPNTLLLDVCCGTGTIGITLAKQVRGDHQMGLFDSNHMLEGTHVWLCRVHVHGHVCPKFAELSGAIVLRALTAAGVADV